MLLSVANVQKHFADSVVLDGVDFRLDRREKVALVGRNGAGKTTLIKILTREYEPDGGSVQWAKGSSVGYLSQHSQLDGTRTVLEEAEASRKHLVELQRKLESFEKRLDHLDAEELEEYTLLHEHFLDQGGYETEYDVNVVLGRMGFEEHEYTKKVGSLSGGEKTRLMLAKLLLEEPDLLILDEPTNHLDLEATEWLEGWLRHYPGGVLLVSHDRTFLQNVAERIIYMRDGKVKSYPGPFDHYLRLKAEEEEALAAVAKKQAQQVAKLDEFVRRFMNSQRTAQARGRQKLMHRLQEQMVEAPRKEKGIAGGFKNAKRSGDIVVETEALSMDFGDEKLFQNLDWVVRWSERWGVIGMNGVGKSTLLKILLREFPPAGGRYRIGTNVEVGYFSQDNHHIDLDRSPMQTLNYELGLEEGPARNLLGRFLLMGDDVMRPARTLSGGERNKLQLAMITAMNPNVLFLDEPTNHLDIDSREALAEILQEFTGTLILVSHDRWLLNKVTNQTLDIRHDQHEVFGGPYEEYRAWKERGKTQRPAAQSKKVEDAAPVAPTLTPRELSKEINRVEKELAQAESDVFSKEADLADLEQVMASAPPDADHLTLGQKYTELKSAVDAAMTRWESLGAQLESLRAQQGVTTA